MSDFEDKLRSLELRRPQPEWGREIFEQCNFMESRPAWRAWFWPSPAAWAALVIIWFSLAIANQLEKPAATSLPLQKAASLPSLALNKHDPTAFWAITAALPQ